MREIREIDETEESMFSRRMTRLEAIEYIKKYNESLEESKVDDDEISMFSRRMTREEASEYIKKYNESLEESEIETKKCKLVIDPSIASIYDIEKTVEHHQHLKRKLKKEHVEQYEDYKKVMGAPDGVSSETIAQRYKLDVDLVESWRKRKRFPTVIRRAINYEKARIEHESQVSVESLEHRIEPESVVGIINEYREREKLSVNDLSEIVERIHRICEETDSVVYAEMHECGTPLVEDRLREIAQDIRANREEIEKELNQRLDFDKEPREVRVAVTDSRLYYWNKDESPDRWLNVLYDQKIYFKTKESKVNLIDETARRLHIRGGPEESEIYLNDLLGQFSRVTDTAANRTRRYGENHYFEGEIFHFVGDVQNKTLDDFASMISHMGISDRGRVDSLKWPELREFKIRSVAIIESDGHLTPAGQLRYFEKEIDRCNLVIDQFKKFGDFEIKKVINDDGVSKVELPMVFGAMLDYWGIPRGDKAIWNKGLSDCITSESLENKRKYKEEVVSEDGCFSDNKFSITRGHVLHAGVKAEVYENDYGIKPLVGQTEIDFVTNHGHPMPAGIRYDEGERIAILVTKIRDLIDSDDEKTARAAFTLYEAIQNNPNELLHDEVKHIVRPFDIKFEPRPEIVVYYLESKRLSVRWSAKTTNSADTCKWAFLSPPNHPRKMKEVVKFVHAHENTAKEVFKKLIEDGFEIHEKWDGWFS